MSNRKAALTLIIVTGLMIGIVFADAGSRSSGPSVPVKPRTTLNSPPSYGSLANFWNGNAYFERSRYASSVSLDESAPLPRPDLGPNVIYTYYRMKVPAGTAQIARARDAIALMVSTDGGASYQAPSDVNEPVVDVGSDICSWDAFNVIAPSVVNVGGTFYMVYEGANLQLGSSTITGCDPLAHYETSGDIGLATSTNGKIWTKYPGTNLGLLLTHNISPYSFECNNIGAPSVTWLNSQFYIFFHGNCGGSGDPKGVQNLDLRNKIGMVHGNNIYGLQSQVTNASPIMDVGIGVSSWDARVNGRPTVIQEGSEYYLIFEGSYTVFCTDGYFGNGGNNAGNWGWGIARTSNIDSGPWEKYAYNPIKQVYQNQYGCQYNTPYIFQFNGAIYVYDFHWVGGYGDSNVLLAGTDPYLNAYPSVNNGQGQCEKWHVIGYVDSSHNVPTGWAQATGVASSNRICYGPYQLFIDSGQAYQNFISSGGYSSGMPVGDYAVTFENLIDSVIGIGGDNIVTQDITYNNGANSAASQLLDRNNFIYSWTYQDFVQHFTAISGQKYEWRTWWYDGAYTRLHWVALRQLIDSNALSSAQIDTTPPTASVNSLPSNSAPPSFQVSWSGSDSQTGIWSFDVQYQDNGGAWNAWQGGTTATSAYFSQVQCYHTYGFQVRARDKSGNVGGYSPTVSTYIPCSTVLSNNPASSDWKGQSGTWKVVNGYMDGSGTSAQIQTSATFSSDRTVSVRTITITSGGAQWKTAYLYGKYVDFFDKLFMFIGTDGSVDIAMWQGSVTHTYSVSGTGLSPYVWHTFTMVISGNTAKAYVDGTLYVTAVDPIIGALGASSIGLASWGPSESQFDSATIT